MAKKITPLSEITIRTAKPKDRDYKLFDGGGLFLLVAPSGSKLWRCKYRFEGKEKLLSFGPYPEISLVDARQRREDARKLLANGVDPGAVRKAQKQAETSETETFEIIAREWHTRFSPRWAASHSAKILSALQRDVFPWIGTRQIKELQAPELLAVLRRIEARGALDTAHRVRGIIGQAFRYAVATGRAERDPTADLRGALPPPTETHHAAITDPQAVGQLLRAIDGYTGHFVVRCALRLAPLLFVRPGELRHAEWSEIDLDKAVWNIPGKKMKLRDPHIVPLSRQAVEILRELHPLTGSGRFVFPSARSSARPMSENAILAALRRMGYSKEEMTGHGFRAMARTMLDEILHENPYVIEAQLAHKVPDQLGRAYNRTTHIDERKKMMQRWSDYLDDLRRGARIIPFRADNI